MKNSKTRLLYFVTFIDSNGHEHYAVHQYNNIDGFVTSMRDLKFEGMSYEKQYNIDKFLVEFDHYTRMWRVLDTTTDMYVGSFWTKEDADEYAEFKNSDFKYLSDDGLDPWC